MNTLQHLRAAQQRQHTYVHVSREIVFFPQSGGCDNIPNGSSGFLGHCRKTQTLASPYICRLSGQIKILHTSILALFCFSVDYLHIMTTHKNNMMFDREYNSPVPTLSLALLPELTKKKFMRKTPLQVKFHSTFCTS